MGRAFCRQIECVLSALLMILLGWSVPVFPASISADVDDGNYLRNSSFADGSRFWLLKGEGVDIKVDASDDEGRGVALMLDAQHGKEIVQTIGPRLEPGARYSLTAQVKAVTDGATANMGVRWEGGYPRVFRGVDGQDGWVSMEFLFEAPEMPGWRQVVLSGSGDLMWRHVNLFDAEPLEARLAKKWEAMLTSGDGIYTGLVVNGAGTPLERGMNPKIYDEDGQLVFAGIGAAESRLFREGIVAYARELAVGSAHPRLQVSEAYPLRLPLIVNVVDTRGFPATDAVISRTDADRIRKATTVYDFLGRFAIVFIVDPLSGLSGAKR